MRLLDLIYLLSEMPDGDAVVKLAFEDGSKKTLDAVDITHVDGEVIIEAVLP